MESNTEAVTALEPTANEIQIDTSIDGKPESVIPDKNFDIFVPNNDIPLHPDFTYFFGNYPFVIKSITKKGILFAPLTKQEPIVNGNKRKEKAKRKEKSARKARKKNRGK